MPDGRYELKYTVPLSFSLPWWLRLCSALGSWETTRPVPGSIGAQHQHKAVRLCDCLLPAELADMARCPASLPFCLLSMAAHMWGWREGCCAGKEHISRFVLRGSDLSLSFIKSSMLVSFWLEYPVVQYFLVFKSFQHTRTWVPFMQINSLFFFNTYFFCFPFSFYLTTLIVLELAV